MSHTPEPWTLIDLRPTRKDYDSIFQIHSPEGFIIADIHNVDPDDEYGRPADAWGDITADTAQVLVTAPKMLAMLEKLCPIIDQYYDQETRDEVLALIAEAGGTTE